jgi:predicted ATPase
MPSSFRNLSVVASRLVAATTSSSQSRLPLHHPLFVGRQQELHELQSALDATVAGRGGVLLLTGEPGIGKTRLAEEATILAQQRNMLVLWGRCWEGNGAPAFWPWVQIIRAYVQQSDVGTLATDMGAGAPHIAHIVAEVRERLPRLPSLPALDPEQARFSLFDSLTTCFKRAASRTPLLLVLDDLHWSDPPSLLLLQFLARGIRNSRLLVLGAYRDVEVDSRLYLK